MTRDREGCARASVQIRHYENTNVLLNQYHHRIVGSALVGAARSHPGIQEKREREQEKEKEKEKEEEEEEEEKVGGAATRESAEEQKGCHKRIG